MAFTVELYVYDLSLGLAPSIQLMLGLNFDGSGIWHTAIVVHGYEWFFGSSGIEKCLPGTTMLGQPVKKEALGTTTLDFLTFSDYINGLRQHDFAGHTYDLFKHNCNTFTNVVAKFLCSKSIPLYILDLPEKFLSTPIAEMLQPLLEGMSPHRGLQQQQQQQQKSEYLFFNHFPVSDYRGFGSVINKEKLAIRLKEINSKLPVEDQVSSEDLRIVVALEREDDFWLKIRIILEKWNVDDVYPFLDLLRWRLHFTALKDYAAKELFQVVTGYLAAEVVPEVVIRLSLQILANYFLHENSRRVMSQNRENVISNLNGIVEKTILIVDDTKREHTEIACSTVALNYAKLLEELKGDDKLEGEFQLVSSLCSSFQQNIKSSEATYRCLVALGTLATRNPEVKGLAVDLGVIQYLTKLSNCTPAKLSKVAEECKKVFAE